MKIQTCQVIHPSNTIVKDGYLIEINTYSVIYGKRPDLTDLDDNVVEDKLLNKIETYQAIDGNRSDQEKDFRPVEQLFEKDNSLVTNSNNNIVKDKYLIQRKTY